MRQQPKAVAVPTADLVQFPDVARKAHGRVPPTRVRHRARIVEPVRDGCVFVVSDQHYTAGVISRSHLASVALAHTLKPWAIVANGDALDAASISRWPVGSFTELKGQQAIADEIKETAARLAEYESMPFVKRLVWNLGNHDARFETKIAEHIPEFAGVFGTTLKDHFPNWSAAWRVDFQLASGETEVVVQHRFKGGMHAGQNNALWAGCSYVTGHDHMLKSYPITQVNRVVWGVHAGTMAAVDSKLFLHYTEDRPVNWQEGFVILQFRGGRFIGPEIVHALPDGRVIFRGEILKI